MDATARTILVSSKIPLLAPWGGGEILMRARVINNDRDIDPISRRREISRANGLTHRQMRQRARQMS